MKTAGIAVAWVGYTFAWWGWLRLGGPVDLMDLIVPGRVSTFPGRRTAVDPGGSAPAPSTSPAPSDAASGAGSVITGIFG